MKSLKLKKFWDQAHRMFLLCTTAALTAALLTASTGCGSKDSDQVNNAQPNYNPYGTNTAYQQTVYNPLNSGSWQFGQQCQISPGVPGIAVGYNCVQQGQLPCIMPGTGQIGIYTTNGCQYSQTTVVYACTQGGVMTPVSIQNQITHQLDTVLLCQTSNCQNAMLSWNSSCYGYAVFPY